RGERMLKVMLGQPFRTVTGCGRSTVRVTPKGDVIPCVYWGRSDLRVENLAARGADGVLASPQFERVRTLPDACLSCPFVSTCHGGCARRRELAGRGAEGGPLSPRLRRGPLRAPH